MISSPAESSAKKPGGPYRKPRADVYTVLLILALIAVLLCILVLYLENEMYDWDYDGAPIVSAISPDQRIVDSGQWMAAAAGQTPFAHHSPLTTLH
ncbi:MAG: hypothetical protein ACYSWU_11565 [Planctomycetota bacterium]|jgi:hypothetical protein